MASSTAICSTLVLLFVSFTAGASAATFTITNGCNFTVWPAALVIPVGGGTELSPGQSWTLSTNGSTTISTIPVAIWGRTGCSFDDEGRGGCQTGDCAGELRCEVSGKQPATLAEYMIRVEGIDISVVHGFNLPMESRCSTGHAVRCMKPSCPSAIHRPGDEKYFTCN